MNDNARKAFRFMVGPHVIENDGYLFICYSRKKTAIEVIKVSLAELENLRQGKP